MNPTYLSTSWYRGSFKYPVQTSSILVNQIYSFYYGVIIKPSLSTHLNSSHEYSDATKRHYNYIIPFLDFLLILHDNLGSNNLLIPQNYKLLERFSYGSSKSTPQFREKIPSFCTIRKGRGSIWRTL